MEQELIQHFWDKRLRIPRFCTFLATLVNLQFEAQLMLAGYAEFTQGEMANRVFQTLVILFILGTLTPSYFNPKYNWMVRFGFMVAALKDILFIYNWVGDHELNKDTVIEINVHMVVSAFAFHFHLAYFNNEERGHLLFSLLFFNLLIFAMFFSVVDVAEALQDLNFFLPTFLAIQVVSYLFVKSESIHSDTIRRIFASMQDHKFIKMVLDTFQHSLVILEEDGKLTYSNPAFKRTFARILERVKASASNPVQGDQQGSIEEPLVSIERLPLRDRFMHKVKNLCQWMGRKEEEHRKNMHAPESAYLSDKEDHREFNSCEGFFDLKIFKKFEKKPYGAEHGQEFAFSELKPSNKEIIEPEIFMVKDPLCSTSESLHPTRRETGMSQDNSDCRFVKLKIECLGFYGFEKTLVQFIDVTDQVLYDISKEEKQLLSMINATISHELRNPLNSVVSQNSITEAYLTKLEAVVKGMDTGPESKLREALSLIFEIKTSGKIQTTAAQMMTFQVQNFLDYAQIKAKKFRVNDREFNIRDAVLKVMQIQREAASANNIDFISSFEGIAERPGGENSSDLKSPLVLCDEQRIMQVLLNLQANAIKFTRRGKIEIRVRIETSKASRRLLGEEPEQFLRVEVVDTGLGVAYEDQDKLFKLFGFGQHTSHCNTSGIGLGLVISEKIVKQLGGEIGFTSVPAPEEGHGSKFYFTAKLSPPANLNLSSHVEFDRKALIGDAKSSSFLKRRGCLNSKTFVYDWQPRQQVAVSDTLESIIQDEETPNLSFNSFSFQGRNFLGCEAKDISICEEPILTKAPIPKTSTETKEPKILIVDDQIFNIKALEVILQLKFGVKPEQCLTAMDGKEAFEIIVEDRRAEIKLILMDCNMPFMDGFESSLKIREFLHSSRGWSIGEQPIISAVTGHAEPKHVKKCFEHGMNQVISKPVSQEALESALIESAVIEPRN